MTRKVIGTHSGAFHCDEVLAIAMLKQLPEYKDADIIRTRDMKKLSTCNIVVDVGAVFDAASHRYDHHQPSFDLTMKDFHPHLKPVVKLSSAGLIYAHFGKRVISEIVGKLHSDADLETLFKQVYSGLISEVDAIDNGVPISDGPTTYHISTGLSTRVGRLNPAWNKQQDEAQSFSKALDLVTNELLGSVRYLAEVWLPAKTIVAKCFKSRFSVHPSGMIMRLTPTGCPWKEHFFELEKEMRLDKDVTHDKEHLPFSKRPVFLVTDRTNDFSVTAIPIALEQPFSKRVPLPLSWAGKREHELDKAVGSSGCVFVHSNRFLGIHKTLDGALEMAKLALKAAGYL